MLLAGCGTEIKENKAAEITARSETTAVTEETPAETETTTETSAPGHESSTETIEETESKAPEITEETDEVPAILESAEDLNLYDIDGMNANFAFTYGEEEFYAYYTEDNWKIVDSYKIENQADMEIICQALADIHPIHGSDGESYRTAEDMAYEWEQHNIAYKILPDDTPWKQNVKDVDINPADQGKSFYQMYKERMGSDNG